MNAKQTQNRILSGDFDEAFTTLYGMTVIPRARYAALCSKFVETYSDSEVRLFSAPGRTEIGGNHTDHQHGRVIAAAVDMDIVACVSLTDESVISIKSEGYERDDVAIDSLEVRPDEKGRSCALIRGVCAAFKSHGYNIGGFRAYTVSNVPKGSGLSSSAAFEVLISTVLNIVYNDGKVTPKEIAAFSQYAESEYFGKPCGLLDQTACAYGGAVFVDFKDPADPKAEKLDFSLSGSGYTMFTVNTGGNHSALTADYAAITEENKAVSSYLGCGYLRDVDQEKFYSEIRSLRKECGDRAVLRAMHFFDEDERAEQQKQAIKTGNFEEFLSLVRESGKSSADLLQNYYPVSSPCEQGIMLAVALAQKIFCGKGAARVHGGGFAGTAQCYVPNDKCEEFVTALDSVFGAKSCTKINIRPFGGIEIKA